MAHPRTQSGVVHVLQSLDRGGAELRTVELVNRTSLIFDFLCLSNQAGALEHAVLAEGHRVTRVALRLWNLPRLWRYFRDPRRKILHSHSGPAAGPIVFVAALAGVRRRIVHFRSDAVGGDSRLSKTLLLGVSRVLVQILATDIIGVTPGALTSAWKREWQTDPRCRVIPNGIDVAEVRAEAEGVANPDKLTLIHVGRSNPAKNRERVLKIWSACNAQQATRLIVVGRVNDDELEMIRRAQGAFESDTSVDVVGESQEVPKLIASSSVLLLPSRREGLPGVVLEALALGVPVVASRLPGTEWISENVGGIELRGLEESDSMWRESVMRMATVDREKIRFEFDDGPFTLESTMPAFLDLWGKTGD